MAKYRFVLLAVISISILGCPGSPYHIAKMNEEEIKSVSDKHLCFAYDQQNRSHLVIREVVRRDIDCVQVLRQANIPVRHIASAESRTISAKDNKQNVLTRNNVPVVVSKPKEATVENPTVTIIDEFHNDKVKAIQKYQQFHPIDFFVADMSVSGDTIELSYLDNTTAKNQWARNQNFQGWNAWYNNTQQSPSYHVTCHMPVSELKKFPELSGSKKTRIQVNAKLVDYRPGYIDLQCKK